MDEKKMLNYTTLKDQYGEEIVKHIKKYTSLSSKLANQKNRRIFLLRCKTDKLKPIFLNLKITHIKFQNVNLERRFTNTLYNKFITATLQILITDTCYYIDKLQREIINTENIIKSNIPAHTFNILKSNTQQKCEKLFQKIKAKNIKKIKELSNNGHNKDEKTTDGWIENLTDTTVPEYASKILSLGPNFAMEITHESQLPVHNIIANIETSINHLTNSEKDKIRSKTCNILTNFKNKLKSKKKTTDLSKNLRKTKKFLKENPQINILRADKTNKTVIMNSSDYQNKMEILLNDKKTYKQIKLDPTNIYQKNNNKLIDRWEQKQYISPNIAKSLKIRNAVPPKIYGLPKLHKENIPLRPIVSCIQYPFASLSKHLKDILHKILYKNNHYIKDSFHFKEKLKNIKLPNDYILLSLDVVSLYTSIPITLAVKTIKKNWNKIEQFTDIPMSEFINATELILKSMYFQYENKTYEQIDGCAMGASISSVIAQLVMEDLEADVIPKLNFDIPFFYRYVDDCLTAIPKNQINYILQKFNGYHKNIQFTFETEDNNIINFLDVTLYHINENIKTEWYTKKTWSSRYLNYESHHPNSQKKSVIIGLADRAIRLSDTEYRKNAITKAKEALTLNKYPIYLINKIFKQRIHKFYNTATSKKSTNNNHNTYIALPFINGLSQTLKKLFENYKIRLCHKSHNLLSSNFSKLKTKTPNNKKSNIIYEIKCNNCEGIYVGQTSQYLENRIKGHKYDKKNSTALTNHERNKTHTFDFKNTKIIKTEKNTKKREIMEAIQIQLTPSAINEKTDVKNLSRIYLPVI